MSTRFTGECKLCGSIAGRPWSFFSIHYYVCRRCVAKVERGCKTVREKLRAWDRVRREHPDPKPPPMTAEDRALAAAFLGRLR